VPLGTDIIHSVINPIDRLSGAIHIYGGDFFATERSKWDSLTLKEGRSDREKARRNFERASARTKQVCARRRLTRRLEEVARSVMAGLSHPLFLAEEVDARTSPSMTIQTEGLCFPAHNAVLDFACGTFSDVVVLAHDVRC